MLRKKDTDFRGYLSAYFIILISSIIGAVLKTFNSALSMQLPWWCQVCRSKSLDLLLDQQVRVRNNLLAAKALTDGKRSKEGSSPDHVCIAKL